MRVALCIWNDDGSPFADFDATDMEDCSAIAVLYWPRRGFVIVASRAGSTRAQLVAESGALTWRRRIDVGARSVAGSPATIAADGGDSFVLVQYGAVSVEPGARAHALAFRYDRQGRTAVVVARRPSPVDLGVAPVDRPDDRIVLARPKAGVVRATLAKDHVVDVTSNGTASQFKQ